MAGGDRAAGIYFHTGYRYPLIHDLKTGKNCILSADIKCMGYQPGKHLIATLSTDKPELINTYASFRILVEVLIQEYQLQKLGEVYHDFSPAGFTAVICLSESHLSIHTWPEHGLINLDIYLSNFKRNNEDAVMGIYQALEKHFAATIVHQQIITR